MVAVVSSSSTTASFGFLSRDPIGYQGSEWSLYEFCDLMPLSKVDPLGLIGRNPQGSFPPNGPVIVNHNNNKNRRCIFRLDPWEPGSFGSISNNGGVFIPLVRDPDQIAAALESQLAKGEPCCEVIIQGHQGGSGNPGGTSHGPSHNGPKTPLFPSDSDPANDPIAQVMKKQRESGACKGCEIYLYACGMPPASPFFGQQEAMRNALAKATGCTIFGTQETCNFKTPTIANACTIDPDKWRPKQKGGPHVYIPTPFYKYPPTW